MLKDAPAKYEIAGWQGFNNILKAQSDGWASGISVVVQ